MGLALQIKEYMEGHLDEFAAQLLQASSYLSPSKGERELANVCGEHLKELFIGLGAEAESRSLEQSGDFHILTWNRGKGNRLMLAAHYDTAFGTDILERNPLKYENGLIYGPGVMDTKGGIMMTYWALKALQEFDAFPENEIVLTLSADEEIVNEATSKWIEEQAKSANYALIIEPSVLEVNQVKTSRNGRGFFEIKAYGKAAHSGSPWVGESALFELAQQAVKIQNWTDLDNDFTCTPTYLESGRYNEWAVPDFAIMKVDVSSRSQALFDKAAEGIKHLEPFNPEIRFEVKVLPFRPVYESSEGTMHLFEHAKRLGEELGLNLEAISSGGGSEGNYTANIGVPTLDGIGMVGCHQHTDKEYADITYVPARTALLARLIQTLEGTV